MYLQPESIRIVIVDDDPFMLKMMTRMLQRLGCSQVCACAGGEAGIRQLSAPGGGADLIFLDINMPGLDGVELIRRLVDLRYEGRVVLVSGENDRTLDSVQRLMEAHRLRSLGYLQKPVKFDDVQKLIDQLKPPEDATAPVRVLEAPFGVQQLKAAIRENRIVCHFQPQVDIRTGEVVGAESLVRLSDADGSLVYPDRFIKLAEEHALIADITRHVLLTAMHQAAQWRRSGHKLGVAINVSMYDLAALDFPDIAASLAESAGIEHSAITLEVTESQVMSRLSTVLDVLTRLRLKRFRLSIDDFGTGHSSLAQLRDLPFDELKIDRGFVHRAATNETLRAICSATLRMAQQLRMQVVAEGVETAEDWQLLEALGCETAQGYLVARPMPAENFGRWRATWDGGAGKGLRRARADSSVSRDP
jgi:EAL domain-containing protein (putative c-di-GMP-specific phosphodiesterase class I)/ActR/RegA family two-component response regulator